MRLVSTLIISIVFFLFLSGAAFADDPPELKSQIGATIQSMFSMDQNDNATNMGFGIRRVRARWYAQYDKAKLFIQTELTSYSLLDARLEYHFSDAFNVKAGRFIGAGVRSGGLTSHTVIDIIERPFTARRWGAMTVGGDYRDYGVELEGNTGDLTGRLWIHNGDGSLNNRNLAGSSASTDFTAQVVDAMVVYKPASVKGLEIGGHYGIGKKDSVSTSSLEKDYNSFSAFAYYNPGGFQLKGEVIGLTNNLSDVSTMGYYVFGGYSITNTIELLARFENYDPNTDVDTNELSFITLGAALRDIGNNHKVTAAIVLADNKATDFQDTIFQVMWQFVFKTK
ncbi:MAG: hypothetical protein KDF60_14495 [Calditrichaeota bacterium]|nr:hypothetical protein [Calditrichota bacterium]